MGIPVVVKNADSGLSLLRLNPVSTSLCESGQIT